jgi:antitoxin FitA
MPKTIQIRDVDDATYHGLVRKAAEVGLTVPEFLRREAARIVSRPSMREWIEQVRGHGVNPRDADALGALDEIRGEWPAP